MPGWRRDAEGERGLHRGRAGRRARVVGGVLLRACDAHRGRRRVPTRQAREAVSDVCRLSRRSRRRRLRHDVSARNLLRRVPQRPGRKGRRMDLSTPPSNEPPIRSRTTHPSHGFRAYAARLHAVSRRGSVITANAGHEATARDVHRLPCALRALTSRVDLGLHDLSRDAGAGTCAQRQRGRGAAEAGLPRVADVRLHAWRTGGAVPGIVRHVPRARELRPVPRERRHASAGRGARE